MNLPSLLRFVALAALWGGSFLFMRIAAPVWGAVPTAFGRVVLGAAGLLALLALVRLRPAFQGKLGAALLLGVFNSGIPFLMFALAARVLPAGYSAILNATTPLMAVVIGALAFGERITWARVGGVLLGMAGVAVLAQAGPVALTMPVLGGMAACLVATACYGLSGLLTRRWITQRGHLEPEFYIETIPYKETREYVARVLGFSVVYDWRLRGNAAPLTDRMLGRLVDDARRRRGFSCQATPASAAR